MTSPDLDVLGVDLAWARKKPDAIVRLSRREDVWTFCEAHYEAGDAVLLQAVATTDTELLVAIDAPTLCINEKGSRPVDQECSRKFRRLEAGCHPVNLQLAPQPIALARKLEELGLRNHWHLGESVGNVIEVYPHPAIVRLFGLTKTIKYKKGKVAEKREHFDHFQKLFAQYLRSYQPAIGWSGALDEALTLPWSKRTEDLLDAHLCAIIGCLHLRDQTEGLGDAETGFIVVPLVPGVPPGGQ